MNKKDLQNKVKLGLGELVTHNTLVRHIFL